MRVWVVRSNSRAGSTGVGEPEEEEPDWDLPPDLQEYTGNPGDRKAQLAFKQAQTVCAIAVASLIAVFIPNVLSLALHACNGIAHVYVPICLKSASPGYMPRGQAGRWEEGEDNSGGGGMGGGMWREGANNKNVYTELTC